MTEPQQPDQDPVIGDAPPADNTLLSNNAYDKLKQVAQIWLPALAVFYITVAPFWGLPKQEEVAGTLMALDLLLGAGLLGLSRTFKKSDARFDGRVIVTDADDGGSLVNFQMDDTSPLLNKDELVVKVQRP
jgi:Putative phage holin Dp-1